MVLRTVVVMLLAGGLGTTNARVVHAQDAAPVPRLTRVVDSVAAATLASASVPGLSVVVMRGAKVQLAKGYGLADVSSRTPATVNTVYQIGSISKQFTAAAIMRLVEQGALRLDDPVSRHLPEYRRHYGDSVRLTHLLRQTSGIREEFTLPGYNEQIIDTTRPNAELMSLIEREPLGFGPGTRWSYSNSNYAILAAIIERVTGKAYDRVLADEFFGPLGLRSMRHCSPIPMGRHHARGYGLDGGRVVPSPPENMNWIRGDGGLCASADDLARWAQLLANGKVVRAASYQRMVSRERLADGTTPEYGFALSLVPLDGAHRRVSHGGRMAGFTAALAYYPDQDVTIAILTNRAGLWIEAMEQTIARTVLGLPRPVVRDVAMTPEMRRRYVGAYDVGIATVTVRITERGNALWLEWPPPGPTSKLLYQSGNTFAAAMEPDAIRVTFERPDQSGRAPRMTVLMAGMHWYGRRVTGAGP